MFREMEDILNLRHAPDAPAHLRAQIIAAAARLEQNPHSYVSGLMQFWEEFKDMLAIPAPAYAFAVMLLLGLTAGFSSDVSLLVPGLTTNELAGFMAINDGFVAGEWL